MTSDKEPKMHRSVHTRLIALLAIGSALMLAGPATAGAAAPKLITPKAGATVAIGSQPPFKVRDGSAAAKKYKIFITISTTRKTKKNGDLKQTSVGTFAATTRKGDVFTYKPPAYSFPTWFLARAGTYYWQAYRIDCAVQGCHVHSKTRSFKVQ
jgi:hypothetical protein